jgi:hypothetical protein
VKATVEGQPFEADSWLGIVNRVLMVRGTRAPNAERYLAARQLSKGVTAVVGGALIKPEGARE